MDYKTNNKVAWNQMARSSNRFARPASERDFVDPLGSVDGPGWLGPSITGKEVLCLAAGGGRQGPLYAAAGAKVTVVDISPEMLEIDRRVSEKKGLSIRLIETSMDNLAMLSEQKFDIVVHPVSTCYVPDVEPVFKEVARVTKSSGLYISQHKHPSSLQTSLKPMSDGYRWKFPSSIDEPLPAYSEHNLVREPGTHEFIHSIEELIGGICRCGFKICDLIEPKHGDLRAAPGSFEHRSAYVSPYIRILALKNSEPAFHRTVIWPDGD